MKPIDVYRQYLTVSIEQMISAAAVVSSLRNSGILHASQSSTLFNTPGMFDSTFTRTTKKRLDDHLADHKNLNEYKIRYGVAILLTSITDFWHLTPSQSIDTLTQILIETKPSVEQMLSGRTAPTSRDVIGNNFNILLIRFTACVLYNHIIPNDKMPLFEEQMEDTPESTFSQFPPLNEFSSMGGG